MKFLAYFLVLLMSLCGVPAMAGEPEDREVEEQLEFQRYSLPMRERYTFENYIAHLKAAALSEEVQPDNPVSRLAYRPRQEYKPLNPIVILWW